MGPTLAIRRVAGLTVAERERLLKWGPDIFGGKAAGLGHLKYRRKPLIWVAYEGTDPVSRVCGAVWTCRIDGEPMLVLGLGGIVTVPDRQGQGLATNLIEEALDYGRSAHADVALLLCLPHRVDFYEGIGWFKVETKTFIHQEAGSIPNPFTLMFRPLARCPMMWSVELDSQPW